MNNEILQLSTQQLATLVLVSAGIAEFFKRVRAKDWWVAATIVSVAVAGGLIAAYWKLDVVTGIAGGLSASGLFSALGSIGNKSTPAPSKALVKVK